MISHDSLGWQYWSVGKVKCIMGVKYCMVNVENLQCYHMTHWVDSIEVLGKWNALWDCVKYCMVNVENLQWYHMTHLMRVSKCWESEMHYGIVWNVHDEMCLLSRECPGFTTKWMDMYSASFIMHFVNKRFLSRFSTKVETAIPLTISSTWQCVVRHASASR